MSQHPRLKRVALASLLGTTALIGTIAHGFAQGAAGDVAVPDTVTAPPDAVVVPGPALGTRAIVVEHGAAERVPGAPGEASGPLQLAGASAAPAGAASFWAENDTAMARMMAAMAVQPSGDVDADFVATMIPHHQGAIDMAQAELRYGRNEQLRRLAQEIVVTQQQEIIVMRLAVGQPRPADPPPNQASQTAPTDAQPEAHHSTHLHGGR